MRCIEVLFPFEWLAKRDSIRREMLEMRKQIVAGSRTMN
jgi:hypothetical protein